MDDLGLYAHFIKFTDPCEIASKKNQCKILTLIIDRLIPLKTSFKSPKELILIFICQTDSILKSAKK